jgi:hypothetical protein
VLLGIAQNPSSLREDARRTIRTVLSAIPREPEGFRLMPVEPTDGAIDKEIERRYPAKYRCGVDLDKAREAIKTDYLALLDAAPRYGQ